MSVEQNVAPRELDVPPLLARLEKVRDVEPAFDLSRKCLDSIDFLLACYNSYHYSPRMVSNPHGSEEGAGSLNERAYSALLDDILEGRLPPGSPVDRKALAERLGMSVAPVHMAVNQMEADGLVVTLPRRGTHVRVYRPEDIRGHRVIRVALEGQASRIYAGEVIAMQLGKLRPLARNVQRSKPANMERIRAEIEFHHELVALADVPMLTRFFDRVMTIGLFMTSSGIMPVEEKPHDNHVQLLDDLCEATPVQAEKRIRKHVLQKG